MSTATPPSPAVRELSERHPPLGGGAAADQAPEVFVRGSWWPEPDGPGEASFQRRDIASTSDGPAAGRTRLSCVLFGGLGIGAVGMGALGAVLPGLPTTIFLIAACWCFARSNPALEQRLVRNRFFGPFLGFLDAGSGMPMRAKVLSLAMMWVAIGGSTALLTLRDLPLVVPVSVVVLGVLGTWMIVRVPTARPRA